MKEQIKNVAAVVLPVGLQEEGLQVLDKHLEKHEAMPLKQVQDAAETVGWAYGMQLRASFNRYLFALEALTVVACFAAAPPTPALISLGAVMLAMTLRDAYTHNEQAPPFFQYYLSSAGDATAATLFLIASQILAGKLSPAMALPGQLMYRGLFVCMPLLATLRMVLRPRPAGGKSFEGKRWSAEQVYMRIWVLNLLWLVLFWVVVAQTVTDRRNYAPDFFRGMLVPVSFGVWVCVARIALRNRVRIETLMRLIRKDEIFRKADSLPQPIAHGEPMFWSSMGAQAVIFLQMGFALLGAAEPFLFGKPLAESLPAAFAAVLGFAVSAMTWKYVQDSNQAAGQTLVEIARGV